MVAKGYGKLEKGYSWSQLPALQPRGRRVPRGAVFGCDMDVHVELWDRVTRDPGGSGRTDGAFGGFPGGPERRRQRMFQCEGSGRRESSLHG